MKLTSIMQVPETKCKFCGHFGNGVNRLKFNSSDVDFTDGDWVESAHFIGPCDTKGFSLL